MRGAIRKRDLPGFCTGPDPREQSWKSPAHWQAVNANLAYLLGRCSGPGLDGVWEQTRILWECYRQMHPVLDRLCANTCPSCPAPCCLVADAGFDLRDLLFLHLCGGPVPLGQPRGEGRGTCRYLGPSGCLLPRMSRPWICTWYLCPLQKQWFSANDPAGWDRLQQALAAAREARNNLEFRFIEALGGHGNKKSVRRVCTHRTLAVGKGYSGTRNSSRC